MFDQSLNFPRICSMKKVFLKISKNSQENTCAWASFLIKLHASALQFYLKKRLWHRCFPVNIGKFLRTPFLTEHLWTTFSELRKHYQQKSDLRVYHSACERLLLNFHPSVTWWKKRKSAFTSSGENKIAEYGFAS